MNYVVIDVDADGKEKDVTVEATKDIEILKSIEKYARDISLNDNFDYEQSLTVYYDCKKNEYASSTGTLCPWGECYEKKIIIYQDTINTKYEKCEKDLPEEDKRDAIKNLIYIHVLAHEMYHIIRKNYDVDEDEEINAERFALGYIEENYSDYYRAYLDLHAIFLGYLFCGNFKEFKGKSSVTFSDIEDKIGDFRERIIEPESELQNDGEQNKRLNWAKLLTSEHIEKKNQKKKDDKKGKGGKKDKDKEKEPKKDDLNPFEKDYLSIVSSQSFRALQDKTQVFPLDKGDYVRTRLTHSMEVSTIARQLAKKIFNDENMEKKFKNDFKLNPEEETEKDYSIYVDQIETIAACAGLLHDMGNPPFGHYGESMIRNWFSEQFASNGGENIYSKLLPQQKADFTRFEGNAQALRLLSKSKNDNDSNLDVSVPVMNSVIKYPNKSDAEFKSNDLDVRKHKNGYYYSENEIKEKIYKITGIEEVGDAVRHPITYIMEAADDIAYTTADLADSIKKEVFTIEQFINDFKEQFKEYIKGRYEKYVSEESSASGNSKKMMQILKEYNDSMVGNKYVRPRNILQNFHGKHRAEPNGYPYAEADKFADKVWNWYEPLEKIWELEDRIKGIEKGKQFAVLEKWLDEMRTYFIECAAEKFISSYDEIISGKYQGDLFNDKGCDDGIYTEAELSEKFAIKYGKNINSALVRQLVGNNPDELFYNSVAGETLNLMKGVMPKNVYDSTEIVNLEISAKGSIEILLKTFTEVMLKYQPRCKDDGGQDGKYKDGKLHYETKEENVKGYEKMGVVYDRFLYVIPFNLLLDFQRQYERIMNDDKMSEEEKERDILYYKLLTVTDFESGMTDSYAANLAKMIRGID